MTDETHGASGPGSADSDIDALLRATATMRPTAEVEERLLLRLRDEVATAREMSATSSSAPGAPVIELDAAAGSRRPPRRSARIAAAAAALLAIGTALVLTRPEAATETGPAQDPTIAIATDVVDAACAANLPLLAAVDSGDYPNGFGRDDARREWVVEIRDATVTVRDALLGDQRATAITARGELDELVEQLDDLVDAAVDRNRGEVAGFAETLARRAELAINDLEALGADSCAPAAD